MAIESVELGEGALRILGAYYLRRFSEKGKAETPLELFARIARKISEGELIRGGPADAEYYEGVFLSLMTGMKFIPSPQIMLNAGSREPCLLSCVGFRIPLDSAADLFDVLERATSAAKKGCQVALRLKAERETTGPGNLAGSVAGLLEGFIERPSSVSISLDLESFSAFRFFRDHNPLSTPHLTAYAQISGRFLSALKRGGRIELLTEEGAMRRVRAETLLSELLTMTRRTGFPSYFLNRGTWRGIRETAPTPCGDNFPGHGQGCVSGSINLSRCLKEKGEKTVLDWEELSDTVRNSLRFLVDAYEISIGPEGERPHGEPIRLSLGVIGFGEVLLKMGIPYESGETLRIAEEIASFIKKEALKEFHRLEEEAGEREKVLLGLVPGAEAAVIAGTSPGLEPGSCLLILLHRLSGRSGTLDFEHVFGGDLRIIDLLTKEYIDALLSTGRTGDARNVSDEVKALLPSPYDVDPLFHMKLQSVFQRHFDGGVFKNIPSPESEEDMAELFLSALKLDLKTIHFMPQLRPGGRFDIEELFYDPFRCEGTGISLSKEEKGENRR
ncbi:MAG: hypothetical protein DRQ06_00405 [Candidatus Hydrothermota bacterium]|uniref:Ribonucleoside-diphosphate reductase n=1 Tax=candidate division WOR-3 bacterium TaxID=2052148 RepID=A0A7C0XDH1_UNCW3|nr:MAG: hypothetical protein DRQ06_00405 [Candidatus Hydrothermae bacterium]RKZ05083.1 MAG: hypothetical protein DRQ04_00095 [Candidatus Hydrothermae bacterium]HDM90518.1 hypothetical protein [candidate division WOR-3 bacterium]